MRLRIRWFLVVWLCGIGLVYGDSLTLEGAWQTALKNSLALQQLDLVRQRAVAEVAIQKAGYLPEVSAVGSYVFTSDVARISLPFPTGQTEIEAGTRNRYDVLVGVDQPVFTGFRTRHLVAAAEKQVGAETVQQAVVQQGILFRVGVIYYQLQHNRLQQKVMAQSIDRAQEHLENMKRLYEGAQTTAFDTLEVANRKLQLQGQLQTLRHQYGILTAQLARVMRVNGDPDVVPMVLDSLVMDLSPVADYQDLALKKRPELARFDSLLQAQSHRISAQQSALWPQVYASAALHYGRPGVDAFRDRWMGYYTVGASVRWRFWDWGEDHRRVEQARLDSAQVVLQKQQEITDIRQAVTEVYRQLASVHDQVGVQKQLVAQERVRYRLMRDRFDLGQATSLDLSDVEKALSEAELALQAYGVSWWLYELQLQFVTGTIGREISGG